MLAEKSTDTATEDASMLDWSCALMRTEPLVDISSARSEKASVVLVIELSESETLSDREPPKEPIEAEAETAMTEEEMLEMSSASRTMSPSTLMPRPLVLAT